MGLFSSNNTNKIPMDDYVIELKSCCYNNKIKVVEWIADYLNVDIEAGKKMVRTMPVKLPSTYSFQEVCDLCNTIEGLGVLYSIYNNKTQKYYYRDVDGSIKLTISNCTQSSRPPLPTCPRCGSTSITTGARGVSGFWGFIGASKTVNRCANCGHTWTPKG